MVVVASSETRYVDYSYKERADCYSAALSLPALERLREVCGSEEEFQREAKATFGRGG
jgi:hypothetical protein